MALTWDSDACVIAVGRKVIGMRRSTLKLFRLTTAESVQNHLMLNMNQFM